MCVQLGEVVLLTNRSTRAEIALVSNPGGVSPRGQEPAFATDGNPASKWLDLSFVQSRRSELHLLMASTEQVVTRDATKSHRDGASLCPTCHMLGVMQDSEHRYSVQLVRMLYIVEMLTSHRRAYRSSRYRSQL